IAVEQGDLTGGQVLAILLVVLGSDHEFRLLILEGIFQEIVGKTLTGIGRQTAGPLGDGTGCVTSLLGADRRQGGAQLVDVGVGQAMRRTSACRQVKAKTAGTDACFLHLPMLFTKNRLRSLRRS